MPDHAKKGRPKKPTNKRKTTAKKGAKNVPKPRVWLMLLLVILIGGGFGAFLYFINGSAEQQAELIEQEPVPKATPSRAAKPLPEKPEESWVYESLDQKEITIELPDDAINTTVQRRRLQCASFRSLSQAETMKAKMAFLGEEPSIKKVKGTTGNWYQVILGPYDTKRQAEATRHKMQRANINTCRILNWTS